ncbi:MAG: tetratricopeptide repeat protein [Anaerolineaceae bacterium]|nr:tetratricopeptide repeat protein [Anaerolineaceae bacterium]
MNLTGKNISFRNQNNKSNPNRVLVLLALLIAVAFILQAQNQGRIVSPFAPTPIPTRSSESYRMEAETHFYSGAINKAIKVYQSGIAIDPENAQLYAELARIQTYSSNLLTTDIQKRERLQEALDNINKAVELDENSSMAHAVRAFVLDWYSNPIISGVESAEYLAEAFTESQIATELDNTNTLALAYYAEILADEQKLNAAELTIREALAQDQGIMDVHRIHALILESQGLYGDAIDAYERAVEITPSLTFLYIQIGVNYRQLREYDTALEYFAKAAKINENLEIKDPIPYLAIGKTYSQTGDFFIASLNMQKALNFDPTNPDIFASVGITYFKNRNYEGAIPALKCAVYGCTAEESCEVRQCDPETDVMAPVSGVALSDTTSVYYYTYGSVLAAMHRDVNGHCEEAMKVLKEVDEVYFDDEIIHPIVTESQEICFSYGYTIPQ